MYSFKISCSVQKYHPLDCASLYIYARLNCSEIVGHLIVVLPRFYMFSYLPPPSVLEIAKTIIIYRVIKTLTQRNNGFGKDQLLSANLPVESQTVFLRHY